MIFIVSAFVSFRYITFGLCLLLVAKCIVTIPMKYVGVPVGGSAFSVIDIVMIVIFIRIVTVLRANLLGNKDILPIILTFFYIFVGVSIAFIFDHRSLLSLYHGIIGNAIYFVLPIAFYLLTDKEKRFILRFAVLVAIIAIGVQTMLILTKNIDAIIAFYPYYQEEEAASVLVYNFNRGWGVRLIPSGIMLILMCSAYTLIKTLTCVSLRQTCYYGIVYVALLAFLISTGTRTFVIVSILVLIYSILSVRRLVPVHRLLIMLPLVLFGLSLVIYFVIQSSLGITFLERFSTLQQQEYHDKGALVRLQDSMNALRLILESPLGIGLTRPLSAGVGARTGMWDVHGVVTVGLLGGFLAIVCLFWFLCRLYLNYKRKSDSEDILACGAALLFSLIITMMNSSSAFTPAENLLAFGIFAGYVLSKK